MRNQATLTVLGRYTSRCDCTAILPDPSTSIHVSVNSLLGDLLPSVSGAKVITVSFSALPYIRPCRDDGKASKYDTYST